MLVDYTVSIDAPPLDVFDTYVRVEHWPEWTETMTTVHRLDPGPIRVGTKTRIKQPKLREAVWEVSEFDPGRSFTWVARMPGLVTTARHVVTAEGDGSSVTLSVEQSGILGPVVGLTLKRLTERYLAIEGAGLKSETDHPQCRVNGDDAPRDRLVENAVRLAAHGGVSHLSLRQLAAELGTSHRMLIYHFGSKDGLVTEIVRVVEEQQRGALDFLVHSHPLDAQEQARLFWDHAVDAASTFGPLFFELTGQALQGRQHTTRLLDDLVDMWIDPLAALYVRQGVDPGQAPVHARLGLAAARGLLLDLLVTGDRAAVDAAMDLLWRMVRTEVATSAAEPTPGRPRSC